MVAVLTQHPPDVDLADGAFHPGDTARQAYRWTRADEPVFRDRNGPAAADLPAGVKEQIAHRNARRVFRR